MLRDVRYGRDVAMLTDLVRCTVLAEDLRQVGPHAIQSLTLSRGSTPIDLLVCFTSSSMMSGETVGSATPRLLGLRACSTQQVEALMATLEARSVVGLAEVGLREEEEGDEEGPMLDASDDDRILRITAIHNRFDASYDDSKGGGYRHLSLSVEVVIRALTLLSSYHTRTLSLSRALLWNSIS